MSDASFVLGRDGDTRRSVAREAHGDIPRLAADRTVFDVLLHAPTPRVERYLDQLTAIGTLHCRGSGKIFTGAIISNFVVLTHA
jgi:hypothetical protein